METCCEIVLTNKLNIKSIITKKECSSGSERIASIVKNLIRIANNLNDEKLEIERDIVKLMF